jgi:hypothetical protein
MALSLAPGQTAFAARHVTDDPGGTDTGDGGMPTGGHGTGTAARDNGARCTITRADGYIDFYLPGAEIARDGHMVMCVADSHGGAGWFISGRTVGGDPTSVGGGGVATQAP